MQLSVIDQTKKWISTFVIQQNICPFAKSAFENEKIKYIVLDKHDKESLFVELIILAREMKIQEENISNAFILFPDNTLNFECYLEQFYDCEDVLAAAELDHEFQLVSFHPDYQFSGKSENDPSNYSNRSPLPMIHILRTKEVEMAINAHGNIGQLLKDNDQRLASLYGKDKTKT